MAKLKRSQLKSIVKECLVEILSEGLATDGLQVPTSNMASRQPMATNDAPSNKSAGRKKFNEAVSNTVDHLTTDPILASIFADTAQTTLQEQLGAESASQTSGLHAPHPESDDELDGVFGDSVQNWAALAFAGTEKNKSS